MSPEIAGLPFLLLAIALYCLPTGIAIYRNHPNGGPIMIINLLLGWTLLGWVIALAWSASAIAHQRA